MQRDFLKQNSNTPCEDRNSRPPDYGSDALPTELTRLISLKSSLPCVLRFIDDVTSGNIDSNDMNKSKQGNKEVKAIILQHELM